MVDNSLSNKEHYLIVKTRGVTNKYIAALVTLDDETLEEYKTYYNRIYQEIKQKTLSFDCFIFNDQTTIFVEIIDVCDIALIRFIRSNQDIMALSTVTFKRVYNDSECVIQGYVSSHIRENYINWTFIEITQKHR